MSQVAELNESEFEAEVAASAEPVVVDFWAPWCPPCRALGPVVDRVAQNFEGRVKVLKCDVDQNPGLAEQFGVQTIPNLTFFKSGQVVDQSIGYVNETQLTAKVEALLKG